MDRKGRDRESDKQGDMEKQRQRKGGREEERKRRRKAEREGGACVNNDAITKDTQNLIK